MGKNSQTVSSLFTKVLTSFKQQKFTQLEFDCTGEYFSTLAVSPAWDQLTVYPPSLAMNKNTETTKQA